jgi:hypothetical protein
VSHAEPSAPPRPCESLDPLSTGYRTTGDLGLANDADRGRRFRTALSGSGSSSRRVLQLLSRLRHFGAILLSLPLIVPTPTPRLCSLAPMVRSSAGPYDAAPARAVLVVDPTCPAGKTGQVVPESIRLLCLRWPPGVRGDRDA